MNAKAEILTGAMYTEASLSAEDSNVVQAQLLTGIALVLNCCNALSRLSQQGDAQFNSDTLETVEHIQSALSEMAMRLTQNTSDLLKVSMITCKALSWTLHCEIIGIDDDDVGHDICRYTHIGAVQ